MYSPRVEKYNCTVMVVADTNIFLAVALNEPEKADIVRLTLGRVLVAPDVLPYELGNALTAMMRKRFLESDQVAVAWGEIQRIPVELRRIDIRRALELAGRFNIYAYDAYFLDCARSCRCPLLTLDRGMRSVAREAGITLLE